MQSVVAGSAITWRVWIAPLVWAVHFLAIYGFTALACARGFAMEVLGVGIVAVFILGASLLATAALLITIRRAVRESNADAMPASSRFVHWLTAAMAGLALLAVWWETLPLIWIAGCA